MTGSLHTRIALRWSLTDAQSFSLPTLRDLVRFDDPKLADEITRHMATAAHVARPSTEGESVHE